MSTRLKIALIILLTVIAGVWAVLTGDDPVEPIAASPSTYGTGPRGCKALFLVLEELRYSVTRLKKQFHRIHEHKGVLVILGPSTGQLRKREADRIEDWVRAGNRVVIFDGPAVREIAFGKQEEDAESDSPSVAVQAGRLRSPSEAFGLHIKEFPDSKRSLMIAGLPNLDAWAKVSVSGRSRWQKRPEGWETVLEDEEGPVVLRKKLGTGHIFAVADSTLPSNSQIGKEQNLRLVLALLLGKGRPGEILFDEYRHGHTLAESFWSYAGSSVLALILLQAAIGLVLFFSSRRAEHAGRFRSLAPPKRRSALEYVDSMANIFETARAGGLALEAILARFLGRLSRKRGIPLRNLTDESLDRVLSWTNQENDSLARLVRQCREAARTAKDPGRALALAQALTREAQDLWGGRLSGLRPAGQHRQTRKPGQ